MATTTVLGVPGPWQDDSDLRRALVAHGVLYAGAVMMEVGGTSPALVELSEADPRMEDGGTFALGLGEPVYRLRRSPSPFAPDDLFHNEHGVWELLPT